MIEVEKQIQNILNKYTNTANEKYLLEVELRLLVNLAEKEQIKKDYQKPPVLGY